MDKTVDTVLNEFMARAMQDKEGAAQFALAYAQIIGSILVSNSIDTLSLLIKEIAEKEEK